MIYKCKCSRVLAEITSLDEIITYGIKVKLIKKVLHIQCKKCKSIIKINLNKI
ncbi:hypothetical protein HS141_15975 [Cetobacterium somerae]|uniref:hypothetical protein n=1 Tax=Cetobacterium somerae TaxID=188913 RepID=UPI00211DBC07|nr:hypothetical protein [Cetobacterium somerae]MCQ9628416.1 hypothetical protein [Cetobacterium somerae]